MKEESGATLQRAGQYTVVLVQENAEGMYMLEGGQLVWSEAPEEANAHFEIAVADAGDGRFVPGLDVEITLLRAGQELWTTALPFLWHPFLYHYGGNARVPGAGDDYTVRAHIASPTFMRHDPVNGKRYAGARHGRVRERGDQARPQGQPHGPAARRRDLLRGRLTTPQP